MEPEKAKQDTIPAAQPAYGAQTGTYPPPGAGVPVARVTPAAPAATATATATAVAVEPALEHQPLVPVPLNNFQSPALANFLQLEEDGRCHIRTRLPCFAYVFMLPFPFFCLGCCIFGASDFSFDDNERVLYAKTWRGVFSCGEPRRIPYTDIANVGILSTSTRVNGIPQRSWGIVLRDGTIVQSGYSGSHYSTAQRALALHAFLFGRNNPAYIPPNSASLALY